MRLFLQAVNHSCPSTLWEAAEVGAGAILKQLPVFNRPVKTIAINTFISPNVFSLCVEAWNDVLLHRLRPRYYRGPTLMEMVWRMRLAA